MKTAKYYYIYEGEATAYKNEKDFLEGIRFNMNVAIDAEEYTEKQASKELANFKNNSDYMSDSINDSYYLKLTNHKLEDYI